MRRLFAFALSAVVCVGTSGCGSALETFNAVQQQKLAGMVVGGQQPVAGAAIQIYAVGSGGDGSAATPLLAVPQLTDTAGNFSIPSGAYTCPSGSALVYLTAMGGNPGLSVASSNTQLAMMTALGACGNLSSSTVVNINELTTVVSVYALRQFMSGYASTGSSTSDAPALANAFALVNQLVNTSTGQTPGPALASGFVEQLVKLNSLADILATCVNSAGGTAAASPCGRLFAAASNGTNLPGNTSDAILAIELNPGRNVQSIFNLIPADAVFQPLLTAAPADWSINLLPQITVAVPSSLVGVGTSLTGTMTLAQAAPAGGLNVSLSSSNTNLVTVNTPLLVPAGATSASFSYSGVAPGAAVLSASASNYASGSAALTATSTFLRAGAVSVLAPAQQASLPITLSSAAPSGGVVVNLSSSNTGIATVSPSTVTIPAGATAPTTNPRVTGVNIGTATLSASAIGYAPGVAATSVTVTATLPNSLSTKVGSTATSTLSISAAAPAGGITFSLSTDSGTVATVGSSVTVPQGATQASFTVSGVARGSTTLRAQSSNIAEADATVLATPTMAQAIQHVVILFDENVSFDHYFATYPAAANPAGEPVFTAAPGTPTVAGLSGSLLTANPNSTNAANGNGASNPFRLDRAQAATADQDHSYTTEEMAFHNGAMDLFPYSIGRPDSASLASQTAAPSVASTNALTMGYYDGNTVTALWNYAQHYALSDHFFESTFGPSTPGALNLISGQTNGAVDDAGSSGDLLSDGAGGYSLIRDPDPTGDLCANAGHSLHMTGRNVGDLLTASNVSWGWFQGGFDLTLTNPNNSTGCGRSHVSTLTGSGTADYSPHHAPFQYYAGTANLNHVRPTSVSSIGANADAANHQYDLHDFTDALAAGNMPSVSFLKAPSYQDGHAGYSDPLDEQTFVVNTINAIEQSPLWSSTAVVIAYDDSDGWYDHLNNLVNASSSTGDAYSANGVCSTSTAPASGTLPGVASTTSHAQGRCGYGPRLPLLLLSPWSRKNYVSSTVLDQSSITRLIEDIFLSGRRIGSGSFDSIAGPLDGMFDFSVPSAPNGAVVTLDPSTGLVTSNN